MKNEWDIIVIGSGMGGMVTAAALSKLGHKVLMLEQYDKLGGRPDTASFAIHAEFVSGSRSLLSRRRGGLD